MTAWETARAWWQDHSTVPFEERLGWHLSCGLVYSTPSAFLMASEVSWDPVTREILQPSAFSLAGPAGASHPLRQPFLNAWFVDLAVLHGSPISLLLQVASRPHEWVLFRRNNGFKIHSCKWSHLAKRVKLES